jgi:1,2-diacylglycerol 3-alpha-glucosyltransferase
MKIGMVTACYKPVINGVTRMVTLYKAELEALGHEVTVFTLGEPDPAGEDADVIRSPALSLGKTGYYFTFGYNRHAREKLKEMDIIHCHHLMMSVEMAHRYGRCPIVYTNHTRYDLYTGAYTALPQPTADAIMRQIWPEFTDYCDVVITPSASVRDVMRDFGVRQPIRVIPNGIHLAPFTQPQAPRSRASLGVAEDTILTAYTGRLAAEKNLSQLLEQFALAKEIVPALHLLLIGSGPSVDDLKEQAKRLGVERAVHFAGSVPYTEVGNYLAAADLFATASITEVHPLTVIEAMAAGLPVAGVRSPGIVDTVEHGRTGFLSSRPAGLSAALVAIAAEPSRRREMGKAARAASARYDIKTTVVETVQLYEELRETRPDLSRQHEHGRWAQPASPPLLEQLARLIRPPEGQDGG